jgi:hypothetical protein
MKQLLIGNTDKLFCRQRKRNFLGVPAGEIPGNTIIKGLRK